VRSVVKVIEKLDVLGCHAVCGINRGDHGFSFVGGLIIGRVYVARAILSLTLKPPYSR
jgi:hypothetical protein